VKITVETVKLFSRGKEENGTVK